MNCKNLKLWKKLLCRLIDLAVVKYMIIFHDINPDLGHKYTSHRRFRQNLIHELVQLLLDAKSMENVYPASKSQPKPTNDPRFNGKHSLKSRYKEGSAVQFVDIKRKPMVNLPSKNSPRFVKNAIHLFLKTALNGIIPKVICVNKTTLRVMRCSVFSSSLMFGDVHSIFNLLCVSITTYRGFLFFWTEIPIFQC